MRLRVAFFAKFVALPVAACCVSALLCAYAIAGSIKPVDRILIEKSKRTMSLMNGTEVLKTYKVALGGQPVGAKDLQGDHKTPEGMYTVDAKIPDSRFHKAPRISYPSSADRERVRKLGVSPGGDVEIHGIGERWGWLGAKHRLSDWTDGCIAVTNEEIDEIYPMIRVGRGCRNSPINA